MVVFLALLVLLFKFADLLELGLLLDLENSLLLRLVEENVEDGLHFAIEIEQVVVADLSDLVDTGLLWHILGRGWLWKELICLGLDVVLLWSCSTLLCEEVGEINFDASGWAWA